jgi:hypothetical protein
MPYRRIAVGVGIVAVTAGAAGVAISFATVSKLGAATLLLVFGVYILGWSGLTMVFHKVTKPADDAYHLGHQIGYDRGYMEGRASARPVVVPMAGASTCLECDNRKRLEDLAGGPDVLRTQAGLGEVADDHPVARRAAKVIHRTP